jgi:hypothetical protein
MVSKRLQGMDSDTSVPISLCTLCKQCAEKEDVPLNYNGDIKLLYDYGFDGVKMDDCGHQRNMTLYAQLMQAEGRSVTIENHKRPEGKFCGALDNSSCPSLTWCPFNW